MNTYKIKASIILFLITGGEQLQGDCYISITIPD
ncbi:hypothetical protein AAHA92_06092 [Salvia divinorum]|uniref:Uncharacterized protein n=1 Tax=Salvia divinorum TaxID=28513 RepID=A0ABD1I4K9_SALDI